MQLQRIKILFLSMMLCTTISSVAQNSMGVGTTTPNPNAVLELVSPTNNQGLLVPRVTTAQRISTTFTSNLSAADNGLMVFDTDEGRFYFWFGGTWNTIRNLAAGDMSTSTYDTDLDGKPDSAQYAQVAGSLDGFTIESSVPAGAVFTDAQSASSVPFTPAGNITATDVQAALVELDTDISTLGAGDMLQATYDTDLNNIVDNAELVNGLTVETAVPAGAVFTDAQAALDVSVTPTVDLSSTNVQDALVELQGEIVSAGGGDMLRSTYDPDQDGIVNAADNATTVNLLTVETAVPAAAVFTDAQTLATNTTPGNISITDGNAITLNVDDADADATNEFQSLDFTGNIITLSNDPGATAIDLSGYDSNSADDFDGSFLSLTEVPVNLDTDATDDFNGSFSSLTDVPPGLADGDQVGPTGTSTTIVLGAADFKKLEDVETGAGATAGTFSISSNQLYPRAQLAAIEGFGKMIAPLNVPNGSRIQQIVVVAEGQAAITLDVVQFGFGSASVTVGTATNTAATISIEGPLNDYIGEVNIDIDNQNFQYALILNNQNSAQSMAIYQVQITYGYNF
jgi:hypothetical protein